MKHELNSIYNFLYENVLDVHTNVVVKIMTKYLITPNGAKTTLQQPLVVLGNRILNH